MSCGVLRCPALPLCYNRTCRTQSPARCPAVCCACAFLVQGAQDIVSGKMPCKVLRRPAHPLSYNRACRTLCPATCPAVSCGGLRCRFAMTGRAGHCVLQDVLQYPAVSCAVLNTVSCKMSCGVVHCSFAKRERAGHCVQQNVLQSIPSLETPTRVYVFLRVPIINLHFLWHRGVDWCF